MKKILILSFSFFLLSVITMSSWSVEYKGVELQDNMELDGMSLERNGYGFRHYVGFLSYVGQIFVKKRSSNVNEVLDPKEPLAFQVDITEVEKPELTLESILAGDIKAAANGADEKAGSEAESNQKEIEQVLGQIVANFPQSLQAKDKFVIRYTNEKGVSVSRNDEKPCDPVKGPGIKMGLFGHWLGPKAVDPAFSDALLSNKAADGVKE